ncbi:hypothetical protein [Streptomyces sp. NPDC020983]|uniref:hypothetical protein n=1 Tax=Streptomyces sp. NPDC020983 TaxID=3365106 RepID=UPI003787748C
MSELWDRIVTELAFLDVVREESRRTILCEPHREQQIRAAVDQAGAADIFAVKPSPTCPPGKLLVLDERALAAAHAELVQKLTRKPWMLGWMFDGSPDDEN